MGMVPLLFMEDDWTKEMREVFRDLDVDGNGCDQCLASIRAIRAGVNRLSVDLYPLLLTSPVLLHAYTTTACACNTRELVSSELEPLFRALGVPDPVDAAAQVCAAHGEDKDTITLNEFLTATSKAGIGKG